MTKNLEYKITDFLAFILPWLMPIPTAFVIGRAVIEHLRFPLWAAIPTAVAIEGMGFFTTANALRLYEYNQTRRKSDPGLPFWIAALTVASYIISTLVLVVILDNQPANAIFPLLSLTAMVTAALRYQHKARLIAIDEDKAERRRQRANAKKVTHHAPIPIYLCEHCGAPFESSPKLAAHMRWQHSDMRR